MATTAIGGAERKGYAMGSSRGSAVLRWWVESVQRRAAREPDRPDGVPSSAGASAGRERPLGPRLVGTLVPLTRLAMVPAGTVAVWVDPDGTTTIRRSGALLVPPLLARSWAPLPLVLPVSTEPVHLDVTLAGLVSLDGFAVGPVTLRLRLRLDEGDGFVGLAALVAAHGEGSEAVLLDPVQGACATAARRAVAANRLANLQRLGLGQVLGDGWLPPSFSGGLLLLGEFEVLEPDDAGSEENEPTLSLLGHPPVVHPSVPAGTA